MAGGGGRGLACGNAHGIRINLHRNKASQAGKMVSPHLPCQDETHVCDHWIIKTMIVVAKFPNERKSGFNSYRASPPIRLGCLHFHNNTEQHGFSLCELMRFTLVATDDEDEMDCSWKNWANFVSVCCFEVYKLCSLSLLRNSLLVFLMVL